MSKANTIRKKALEYARRQQWEPAIREYKRLSEIDQSNPNLYNELGDIYLKTGNKSEAYDSFATAIDAYARVSLYNNAVAVCKKVLRLIPSRYDVLAKLGCIRKQQGLAREAESYCVQYLDALSQDAAADAEKLAATAGEIARTMDDCAVVLDRLAECLVNNDLEQDAAGVLVTLHELYRAEGITEAREEVRKRLDAMGMAHKLPEPSAAAAPAPAKEGPVMTEDNLWTDSLSEGQRMAVDGDGPRPDNEAIAMGAGEGDDGGGYDNHTVELPDPGADADAAPAETPAETAVDEPAGTVFLDADEEDAASPASSGKIQVSAIIDGDDGASAGNEDYRSHYDLGMAYLEMNLFAEAIREYQIASRSPEYKVKSLEMVGLCFLHQNQPQLAIKQLTRGLAQIDQNDTDALGIKYNLGLAYEMIGETEKARAMFEDVYVVDVTFRDVSERIAALSS